MIEAKNMDGNKEIAKCKNCKYFLPDSENSIRCTSGVYEPGDFGNCFRYPPVLRNLSESNKLNEYDLYESDEPSSWACPAVADDNWCGEYQSKNAVNCQLTEDQEAVFNLLPARFRKSLRWEGVKNMQTLLKFTYCELLEFKNVGKVTVDIVCDILEKHGMKIQK